MGKWSITVLFGSLLVLASASAVQAAELQVIAGGGIAAALNEIAVLFERASGHKVVIRYGTAPELIKMAASDIRFDLGVAPQDVWTDAAARAQLAPGPRPDVARVGIGVAVRSGAPKPDISKAQTAPRQIADAVANCQAELAVFGLNVLIDPRLEIVGPFPAEVQREVVYVAGVAGNSKEPEAAKAFLAYLMSPPAIAVIKAKGLNPG